MNNTFKEIAKVLEGAGSVLIYPHIGLDGDAVGSSVALCKALRKMGKDAYVLLEDDVPINLKFLDKGYCTDKQDIIKDVDISMCVDCGEEKRFPLRTEKFRAGKTHICVDHHQSSDEFCEYNYIDPAASAAGELVYDLIRAMDVEFDLEMAENIFAAITTDTGNFQYSNTTRRAFEIMAELIDIGLDTNKVSVELYDNVRLERKIIETMAFSTLEMVGGGKGAIAFVTQEMLAESGAFSEETENVIRQLRSIAGVEYAAFLKEKEDNLIRLSLRAKTYGDVAVIAEKFGGGGHIKASGARLEMKLSEAVEKVKAEIEATIKADEEAGRA